MDKFLCTQCGKVHSMQLIKYWHENWSNKRIIDALYCSGECATADHESGYKHPYPLEPGVGEAITAAFKNMGLIKSR